MKYFGVMLDMSRNAVMKVEQVKKFARYLKSFGYNMLQLYTEDTYEVDGEPYFGHWRGRYTKEELKEIDSYCASIGIEVIPCIQTLAHLNQALRWKIYEPINDCADILLIGEERTYQLIDNMFKSLREAFKTDQIHIGMDEAQMVGLGKYLDKHGARNRFDILLEHLARVVEIAKKYGFKPMMWSDMFFRLANEGEYYVKDSKAAIPESVKASTPREVGLVYWDYYHTEKSYYVNMLKAHQQFNNDVWFAGGVWTWAGFAPRNRYSIKSMKAAMSACRDCGVDNIFMTMWGDNGKECSFYSVLPSLFAVKKFYDGETSMNKIKAEFKAITGEDFDQLMALDLPNLVGGIKDEMNCLSKYGLFNDPFLGVLDSTVRENTGEEFKSCSRRLAKYAKTSQFSYLFDCISKLSNVLAVKYELGVKTRTAYQAGDMEKLKSLVGDYRKAERVTKTFYEAFKKLWFEENKSFGFETHEIRLGGLILRLHSCGDRLQAYVNGEISEIPELKESLLDYNGGGEICDKEPVWLNWWTNNVTPSIM